MQDLSEAQISPAVEPTAGCVICLRNNPAKKCGRCHTRQYCSSACQKADWKSHRLTCRLSQSAPAPIKSGTTYPQWYDEHRRCEDGNKHEGRLELITWSAEPADEEWDEPMGWGNTIATESDELKRKFENEFHSDEVKMYEYWP